jgi:citrate lyase beta subunit
VLPKVTSPDHVVWLDLLLGQVEREAGLPPGQTGLEAGKFVMIMRLKRSIYAVGA